MFAQEFESALSSNATLANQSDALLLDPSQVPSSLIDVRVRHYPNATAHATPLCPATGKQITDKPACFADLKQHSIYKAQKPTLSQNLLQKSLKTLSEHRSRWQNKNFLKLFLKIFEETDTILCFFKNDLFTNEITN